MAGYTELVLPFHFNVHRAISDRWNFIINKRVFREKEKNDHFAGDDGR